MCRIGSQAAAGHRQSTLFNIDRTAVFSAVAAEAAATDRDFAITGIVDSAVACGVVVVDRAAADGHIATRGIDGTAVRRRIVANRTATD